MFSANSASTSKCFAPSVSIMVCQSRCANTSLRCEPRLRRSGGGAREPDSSCRASAQTRAGTAARRSGVCAVQPPLHGRRYAAHRPDVGVSRTPAEGWPHPCGILQAAVRVDLQRDVFALALSLLRATVPTGAQDAPFDAGLALGLPDAMVSSLVRAQLQRTTSICRYSHVQNGCCANGTGRRSRMPTSSSVPLTSVCSTSASACRPLRPARSPSTSSPMHSM